MKTLEKQSDMVSYIQIPVYQTFLTEARDY